MRYYKVVFIILLCLCTSILYSAKKLIYDKFGTYIDTMDDYLLKMEDVDYIGGGTASRKYNHQRWIEDFRTDLVVSEVRDDMMNEFRLGRIYTKFTPLTLDKTRFPPNFADDRQHGFKWRFTTLSFLKEITFLLNRVDLNSIDHDNDTSDINEENVDTYFVALRTVFQPISSMKVGLSYVNQHNSFRSILTSDDDTGDPLAGSLNENNYPSKLYMKFSDLSVEDDGGAAVYNILVYINGVKQEDLCIYGNNLGSKVSLQNYGSSSYSDRREANGSGYFVYSFELPDGGRLAKEIKFVIDMANNYSVIVSSDQNFVDYKTQTILTSPEDIKDYSNRKAHIYYFSMLTGQSLYSIDCSFNLGKLLIKTEFVHNKRFLKFPNKEGERYSESANAYYIEGIRSFRYFSVGGGAFRIEPEYDASYSVEDNDDDDDEPDSNDGDGVNFWGNDRNNNDIKDYNEDFMLFDSPDYGFRDGIDYNNNDVFDNEEDDNLPDYPYYTGEEGYHMNLLCWITKRFNMELGQFNSWLKNTKLRSFLTYLKTNYSYKKYYWFEVKLRNVTRRINDNIKNDTNEDDDKLLYQDDLVNNATLLVDFLFLKNFIIQLGYRNVLNFDQFSSVDFNKYSYYTSEFNDIFRFGYNWTPFEKAVPELMIRPLYKLLRTSKHEFYYNAGSNRLELNQYDYFILEFIYNFTKNTRLLCGYQKAFYQDSMFNFKDNQKDSYAFQISHKNTFKERGFILQAGYDISSTDYYENYIYEDKKERRFYIESYFNW